MSKGGWVKIALIRSKQQQTEMQFSPINIHIFFHHLRSIECFNVFELWDWFGFTAHNLTDVNSNIYLSLLCFWKIILNVAEFCKVQYHIFNTPHHPFLNWTREIVFGSHEDNLILQYITHHNVLMKDLSHPGHS